jgi:hypothetical protein
MYIPDDAITSGNEVSVIARVLYFSFCLHRDSRSGISMVSPSQACSETGIAGRTYFYAKKELIVAGWVEKANKGVRCIKGFYSRPRLAYTYRDAEKPVNQQAVSSSGSPRSLSLKLEF